MGLAICPNLHRNSDGDETVGRNCFGDRQYRKSQILAPQDSGTLHLQIHFFLGEGRAHELHTKLARTVLANGLR